MREGLYFVFGVLPFSAPPRKRTLNSQGGGTNDIVDVNDVIHKIYHLLSVIFKLFVC